jgi:hypothetical protein
MEISHHTLFICPIYYIECTISQVVKVFTRFLLPRQLREMILRLGHGIPLAGHLGNKKTRDRIMQHFFGQVYLMIYQSTVDLVLIAR